MTSLSLFRRLRRLGKVGGRSSGGLSLGFESFGWNGPAWHGEHAGVKLV